MVWPFLREVDRARRLRCMTTRRRRRATHARPSLGELLNRVFMRKFGVTPLGGWCSEHRAAGRTGTGQADVAAEGSLVTSLYSPITGGTLRMGRSQESYRPGQQAFGEIRRIDQHTRPYAYQFIMITIHGVFCCPGCSGTRVPGAPVPQSTTSAASRHRGCRCRVPSQAALPGRRVWVCDMDVMAAHARQRRCTVPLSGVTQIAMSGMWMAWIVAVCGW